MSALKGRTNSLAGLSLDAVLGGEIYIPPSSPPSPPPPKSPVQNRPRSQTLFDIIREEYAKEGHKDRTTWQIFREKLRLKTTGSAWTSSLYIPASDILIPVSKQTQSQPIKTGAIPMSDPPGSSGRGMFTRGSSMRVASGKNPDGSVDGSMIDGPSSRSFKPQLSRHDSVRDHGDGEEDSRRRQPTVTFVEERTMSAREAVAAQEAAEAAGGGSDDDDEEEEEEEEEEEGDGDSEEDDDDEEETDEKKLNSASSAPKQTMSLFDLLAETDREMGLIGSRYAMDYEYEEEEEEDYDEEDSDGNGDGDLSCCMCYVKIKGASFNQCGHTFCKLCSKEHMAQKGHCPVCSSFVLEFLEIF